MTTKTDGDRLLRAAVTVLSTPGWGLWGRNLKPLLDVVESVAPGRVERARTTVKNKAAQAREAARWQGPVPAWAKALMNKHAPGYKLQWRVSAVKGYTSGRTYWGEGRIVVTVGPNRAEQKSVLLHEIAHALTPLGEHHGEQFWDELYLLAVAEGNVLAQRQRDTRSFIAAQRRARKRA